MSMFPIGSRLQVVTTVPKCDAVRPTKSLAPLIWLKILFTRLRDEPENTNNLKIFDFLKSIFILYPQRGGKRYFSFRIKTRIHYKYWRIFFSGMCHATYVCTLIASIFNVINTGLHKCFLMS